MSAEFVAATNTTVAHVSFSFMPVSPRGCLCAYAWCVYVLYIYIYIDVYISVYTYVDTYIHTCTFTQPGRLPRL